MKRGYSWRYLSRGRRGRRLSLARGRWEGLQGPAFYSSSSWGKEPSQISTRSQCFSTPATVLRFRNANRFSHEASASEYAHLRWVGYGYCTVTLSKYLPATPLIAVVNTCRSLHRGVSRQHFIALVLGTAVPIIFIDWATPAVRSGEVMQAGIVTEKSYRNIGSGARCERVGCRWCRSARRFSRGRSVNQ